MASNSIELFQENEDWVVVVMEDSSETRRTFRVEQHARSFADGQRVRLGLPPVNEPLFKSLKDADGALIQ